MKHWQQYSKEERAQLIYITSAATGLPPLAIEKDWWVSMVLKALSLTRYAGLLSFKGGTSLSKGWRLIERFSEDIDIALDREGRFAISGTSNAQLAKERRVARHYVVRELPNELTSALESMRVYGFSVEAEMQKLKDGNMVEMRADSHPSVIYVNYESIFAETSEYLQPRVKIEISSLSMDGPVVEKELRSLIAVKVPDAEDVSVKFNTVVPTRTFLEKVFLLHEEFQKKNPRSYRLSRHLYDLERMMDTTFGKDALSDKHLYMEIVDHRSKYNKLQNIDYQLHGPSTINIVPPDKVIEDWRKDYRNMCDSLIYGHDTLPFDKLIARIRELQERIRHI